RCFRSISSATACAIISIPARGLKSGCNSAARLQQLAGSRILSNMPKTETAILGGGCFWCVEAAINQLEGVQSVVSGYMGGRIPNPSYEQVCSGRTGHVEVAEITFDPETISYDDLLHVFFTLHDPTTLNRQGNDVGEQYRSVIFYRDEEQHKTAQKVIDGLTKERAFGDPIVTAVEPASMFYPAEEY